MQLSHPSNQPPPTPTTNKTNQQSKKPEWVGASTGSDADGRALYRAAKVGSWQVSVGDVVQLPTPDDSDDEGDAEEPTKADAEGDVQMGEAPAAPVRKEKMPPVGLVQCLLQDKSGEKVAQVRGVGCCVAGCRRVRDAPPVRRPALRWSRVIVTLPHTTHHHSTQVRLLLPGAETVLGDAASEAELFVTDDYTTLPLAGLPGASMRSSCGWAVWVQPSVLRASC